MLNMLLIDVATPD